MAEKRMVEKWFSFDGIEHGTEAEALRHEDSNYAVALVGLTTERVRAIVAREPGTEALGDAVERAAYLISKARLAAGDLKRVRRVPPNGEPANDREPAPETAPSETPPPESFVLEHGDAA